MAREGDRALELHIEGMCCEAEVELIRRKMRSLTGLGDFELDLIGERLRVFYDPALISAQDIIKAIAETGMRAAPVAKRERGRPWWQERKIVFLFTSGFFTLVAFLLQQLGVPELGVRALYGLAIAVGGYYPAKLGLGAIRALTLNINTLLIVAALGALGLGLWEEAAILVFVYSLGGVLEAYAVDRARGSIRALMEFVPKEALVKRNGEEIVLPVEEVRVGDTIIIRPGERIPLDGRVIAGSSTVDQAPITGESIPAGKGRGDEVFAGTINRRGSLEVEVTRLAQDTTLARIIHAVEEAQAKKSSYQRFGERFGRYYTPAMFLLALAVATVPPLLFHGEFTPWFYRALVLLVVSCSCGLGLSVPVSVVAAISNAARQGILIKGGAYLEAAADLAAIAFDKPGTLTIGRPLVTDIVPLNGSS
ncbi:MAG: heavy metal translocating P-type ATPase, partial [Candidatus Bipolaricaulia bacterium]